MAQPQPSQAQQRRFLIVRSGGVRCAIPAAAVRRVVRSLPVTPVPGGERELLGLAQFGGEPLVVLDLLALLGAGEEEQAGALEVTVVVAVGSPDASETVGVAVDEALEVATIEIDSLVRAETGVVVAQALVGSHVVRVLDLGALGAGK